MNYTTPLIALTGHKGSGKDTVADLIVAAAPSAKKFAFADALREEVCAAFRVPMSLLTDRETKERATWELAAAQCTNRAFVDYARDVVLDASGKTVQSRYSKTDPLSPRHIMQWWGAWRRQQNSQYWVERLHDRYMAHAETGDHTHIITDCRHENEASYVHAMRGVVIRITRAQTDRIAAVDMHESERGHAFAFATHIINNDGTLTDLEHQVHCVLGQIERRAAT